MTHHSDEPDQPERNPHEGTAHAGTAHEGTGHTADLGAHARAEAPDPEAATRAGEAEERPFEATGVKRPLTDHDRRVLRISDRIGAVSGIVGAIAPVSATVWVALTVGLMATLPINLRGGGVYVDVPAYSLLVPVSIVGVHIVIRGWNEKTPEATAGKVIVANIIGTIAVIVFAGAPLYLAHGYVTHNS